ncbi:MAG: anthranilate phosphoribosyltransferase [Desulfobacterales bacterium]|jgi:anthranilate phosphoribosyltransferase|nr:anthranilate phosphoribosyltransferase [Desulfobacterales bacterium]
MFLDYLKRIIARENLNEDQMAEMMNEIFSGQCTDAQIGAFMAALATKGETFAELAGAARAMRKKALRLEIPAATLVDIVGTGGDSAHTFNISTTTAFVVAGCGVPVAKHGNRAVSSKCGSADVLEALGVNLNLPPELVEEAVMEIGIGFLFAPLYHKAMKYAATARKEIGLRSIFNMLGPLTNPAAANCMLLGVFSAGLTEMFANALKLLGAKRAFVVHGHDGLDEITVCAKTRVSELANGAIQTYDISPESYFGGLAPPEMLKGGDVDENAGITQRILAGEPGPRRNVVLFNAAAALLCAGKATDLRTGIQLAETAIDTGAAAQKLNDLIRFTNENA